MHPQFVAQCIASANSANAQGQYSAAIGWCQKAIRHVPKLPEAWYNLGVAYRGLGQNEQAVGALKQSATLVRDNADAQNSIGYQLLELGALPDAERCLRRALSLAPRYAFAHSNLGMLQEKMGRLGEAEASFRTAIEIQPDLAPVYLNLSAVLNRQKKYVLAEAAATRAIELDASSSEAWNNLGGAYSGQNRFALAEAAARKSLEIDPKSVETWRNLGESLLDQDKHREAIDCFLESLRLDPQGGRVLKGGGLSDPHGERVLGGLLRARMQICDWGGFDEALGVVVQQVADGRNVISPFSLLALSDDATLHRKAAARYVQDEQSGASDLGALVKQPRHDKVRIGYYSADFHNHATMYLMAELFEQHDKSRFELIGFSFGPDIQDEMRGRASAAFGRFIDVRDRSDQEVAQLSRDLGIDIAVDLKGYTKDSRPGIFAYRAAPIQANYLGYPGTMAADFMDYIIADRVLVPETSQSLYTEKIVYLPNSYQVNDAQREISAREFTRTELGLPDRGFVFACFNNNYKITPSVFAAWMRILKQVQGAVLWLFEANSDVVANLRKEAAGHGVDAERLVFARRLPLAEHLSRIRNADLFLDTLPYNAHTTASDALWAGLPVLTCCGQSFAARVAASLLNAIGLPELVTDSPRDYEKIAVELANAPERLQLIREKLARNRLTTPLFDACLFARHIEAAYLLMYKRWLDELSTDHIYVGQEARSAG
ncbi:MAG: tetratricopeptide repeat protein [Azonexaceae bacterium]|nr:tetratricopeptide repeat protein [Azonexaceae bacterium]